MEIASLGLEGPLLLTPRRFGDARGWFSESWSARRMAQAGLDFAFVQDNAAYSRDAGVLRGLHFQAPPMAQTKLVRCTAGRIFDVVVDARRGSPSYGQWRGAELSAQNGRQMLAPRGFLHGYLTLTPHAEVAYKVDAPYAPECDGAVVWNDPGIGVEWPLAEAGVATPILSEKDARARGFNDFDSPFVYEASP